MEHLEFTEKLNELGIKIQSTNKADKEKTIEIKNPFGIESDNIEIKNFKVTYKKDSFFQKYSALDNLIIEAIDIDEWKHSFHNEIIPENYDRFRGIIQRKILKRASEIDFLITVYFLLNHEIANNNDVD